MSTFLSPLVLPGRIATPSQAESSSPPVPMGLPPLRDLGAVDGPRLSIALMDGGGRLQDRGAVAALGWSPGDRLLITLIQTSVVIRRRPDGVFVMPRKPYVVLPAPVRKGCGALAGSRLLLVADPAHDVLIVHPEAAVQAMLRTSHTSLAAPEEEAS
ncbi:hypothetical protein [Amycolatopsis sp. WQ 127309]|uniref:hypothetical protein n=1 Tax=Amycolatopsis sp. WQ 127309 TaxID=2932773 RepID=UPI001FF684C1|nr:hypothetical protein [Amycolatopsis sp. WQ 127309]UOZ05682.1 hypothetical protein MUY22_43795 [Amycolatopsis sp. WQ 127309]